MFEIFNDLIIQKGLSLYKVAKDTKLNAQLFYDWKKGRSKPKIDKLQIIADYLGVSVAYLQGRENEQEESVIYKIPILGSVPCGIPLDAVEDVLGYIDVTPRLKKDYFGLVAKGNSMHPYIEDGDLLIVHYTPSVESGKIAIIKINGNEATCKKILIGENGISVVPLNREYNPVFYTKEQVNELPVFIVGEVEEVRRYL